MVKVKPDRLTWSQIASVQIARPSRADIDATRKFARLADDLGLVLLDHFIIAGEEVIQIGHF